MSLVDDLRQIASVHGATLGVTDLAPFPDVAESMRLRHADGTRARLGFTYHNIEQATEPSVSFPWARSIVAVAVGYLTDGDGVAEGRSVARFADGDRYRSLTTVLHDIAAHLGTTTSRCEIVYDDERLVDRAVAERSGVGWWGKSTMVLTPGQGPWVLIGSVVTDADLPQSEPMRRTCGTCDACIPACPTGAIVAPGVLDARRCLAAIFQSRGDIPRHLRVAAGGRIYGCDDCLTSCPPGFRALRSLAPSIDDLSPAAVLGMSDRELDRHTEHWYVPGRQVRFVRRNALVAIGNVGGEESISVVMGYVGHPDALLRCHAVWALGALAPEIATAIGPELARSEADPAVLAEIEAVRAPQH